MLLISFLADFLAHMLPVDGCVFGCVGAFAWANACTGKKTLALFCCGCFCYLPRGKSHLPNLRKPPNLTIARNGGNEQALTLPFSVLPFFPFLVASVVRYTIAGFFSLIRALA